MNKYDVDFISPLSSDVLDTESRRAITVKVNGNINSKMVKWLTFPSGSDIGNIKFTKNSTPINKNGLSTNYLITGDEIDNNLLISVYVENDITDPDHYSAIYKMVNSTITSSLNSTYCTPTENYDPEDVKSSIAITIHVVDDDNTPLNNYPLKLKGQRTLPIEVHPKDIVKYDEKINGYVFQTNENGQVTINLSNTSPAIIEFNIGAYNRSFVKSYYAVFTYIGDKIASSRLFGAPSLSNIDINGVLDLDKIKGDLVEVIIPEPDIEYHGAKIAIMINNQIPYVSYFKKIDGIYSFNVNKKFFKTNYADNFIAYILNDRDDNGSDSETLKFKVTGSVGEYRPEKLGNLEAPCLVKPGTVVNYAHIVGGLEINIPRYDSIEKGDEVITNIYLNAYFVNSNSPKTALLTATHTVIDSELTDGFTVLFQQVDLEGFAMSKSGKEGTFQAQYIVNGENYSQILQLRLNDASLSSS
ncbi:MAG: hypothetical protein LBI71_06150 [Enterobacteriaceae bacterium]|jgi:hypothetical protein|nr:hypothetical protein [Enterobacteriaceae bacterium]